MLTINHNSLQKSSQPEKKLIIPGQGKQPSFKEVTDIVVLGLLCDLSVGVVCLTEENMRLWQDWQAQVPQSDKIPDVLDTSQVTLGECTAFARSQQHDLTVLHGAHAELQAGRMSTGYVTGLVSAVPAGLVVIA